MADFGDGEIEGEVKDIEDFESEKRRVDFPI